MATASSTRATVESHFPAMGSEARLVLVDGDEALLELGRARIDELERRWSRFLDTSEVSGLNRFAGRPVIVSPDTVVLVERSLLAAACTEGRFDPTVGAALVAHGYDRDFTEIAGAPPSGLLPVGPAPGPAGIDVDPRLRAVTLAPGLSIDPGGIGKGLAADLTASRLLEAGAAGALVELGGDLRAVGAAPTPDGWSITVPDPLAPDRELMRIAIPEGAVATSSRLKRRWRTSAGEVHHLIDPASGRPAATDVVAVTVVTGEAWWAEALTKSLFLTGPAGLGDIGDAHAVVVTADGGRHATAGLRAALR